VAHHDRVAIRNSTTFRIEMQIERER
jgi:hypothetical protein